MKKITTLFLLFVLSSTAFAQTKIYWIAEGGLLFSRTRVDNLSGAMFKPSNYILPAPLGIKISVGIGKNFYLDGGAYVHSLSGTRIKYGESSITGNSDKITSLSFRLKHTLEIGSKFTFSPFAGGAVLSNINNVGVTRAKRVFQKSAAYQNGTLLYRDSLWIGEKGFPQNNNLEAGIELAYKINSRLQIISNIYYVIGGVYKRDYVDYHRTGQGIQRGTVTYESGGTVIQLGLKWNWRDVVKPGSYTIEEKGF